MTPSAPISQAAPAAPPGDPLIPFPAILRSIEPEIADVATFRVEFQDPEIQRRHDIRPGQFNMLYLPGVGEVPISVAFVPGDGPGIGHTIRFVGRVTRALADLQPGAVIGLRGPYGAGWPMERAEGRDVLIVAGGLGLAPLRPVVRALLADRDRLGSLTLLYGSRRPEDLLYQKEYPEWERRGMEVLVTVDRADASWRGRVGVVPVLLRRRPIDPGRALVMTCGPEIMMRYAIAEVRAGGVPDPEIYVSLERHMQCAVGFCGHCQLGPEFVCKDGPVFAFDRVARFFGRDHF